MRRLVQLATEADLFERTALPQLFERHLLIEAEAAAASAAAKATGSKPGVDNFRICAIAREVLFAAERLTKRVRLFTSNNLPERTVVLLKDS